VGRSVFVLLSYPIINNKMKKTFNVTIAITVESEAEIEDIRDIDFDVEIKSKDAKIKVIDIPESYEVLI
jgi:hypothetical protein